MSTENGSANEIWAQTVDQVKRKVNNISFWEALEHTVPVTLEGDVLVLGLPPNAGGDAGHFARAEHRNAIDVAASQFAGRKISFRLIDGCTLGDWEATKVRDQRAAAARETTYVKRDSESAQTQNWEVLYEYAARCYSNVQFRNLPQGKARYLTDMLYVMSDAVTQLNLDPTDEYGNRQLARTIDRVAHNAEVPPALVALELERLRAWQKQSEG
ncbi:MAG: hypothetical protein ABJA67_10235 [Chthonomonadales bacterium]